MPARGEQLKREEVWRDFREAVNMSPSELCDWLETDTSQGVGWKKEGDNESIGHKSGHRIVDIKRKNKEELDDDDYEHMRKVVGFVHRHLKQGGPEHNLSTSRWRYSLMNWGHDPMKD